MCPELLMSWILPAADSRISITCMLCEGLSPPTAKINGASGQLWAEWTMPIFKSFSIIQLGWLLVWMSQTLTVLSEEPVNKTPGHWDDILIPLIPSEWADKVHRCLPSCLASIIWMYLRTKEFSCCNKSILWIKVPFFSGHQKIVGIESIPENFFNFPVNLPGFAGALVTIVNSSIFITAASQKNMGLERVPI